MHATLSTTDRPALHNPFAPVPSFRLNIGWRGGRGGGGVKAEPIITHGNQAIWHADQWTLDWWVSYLDERPPRGTLALPYYCHRGGVGVASRSPRGHSRDATRGTNTEGIGGGIVRPRSVGFMQTKRAILPFYRLAFLFSFNACGTGQGGCVTRNDCGSLKNARGRCLEGSSWRLRGEPVRCDSLQPQQRAVSRRSEEQICGDFDSETQPEDV